MYNEFFYTDAKFHERIYDVGALLVGVAVMDGNDCDDIACVINTCNIITIITMMAAAVLLAVDISSHAYIDEVP